MLASSPGSGCRTDLYRVMVVTPGRFGPSMGPGLKAKNLEPAYRMGTAP